MIDTKFHLILKLDKSVSIFASSKLNFVISYMEQCLRSGQTFVVTEKHCDGEQKQ